MDMKKFYGKTIGDYMGAIGVPIAYFLVLAHVLGRPKGSPDCYASDDIDETAPKTADELSEEE
jgi:hypothetical protein